MLHEEEKSNKKLKETASRYHYYYYYHCNLQSTVYITVVKRIFGKTKIPTSFDGILKLNYGKPK
jgi:hypothetical protein